MPHKVISDTKRTRMRLVRADLWLHLAMAAERWARECEDSESGTRPFAEWPADDALVTLCRTYHVKPANLAKACREIAQQNEDRASATATTRHTRKVAQPGGTVTDLEPLHPGGKPPGGETRRQKTWHEV